MKIWLDAQLSPSIAPWLERTFEVEGVLAVQADPRLRAAQDREIFAEARASGAVVMTKDRDFVGLLDQLGPPPSVIWLTCGIRRTRAFGGFSERRIPKLFGYFVMVSRWSRSATGSDEDLLDGRGGLSDQVGRCARPLTIRLPAPRPAGAPSQSALR